MAIMDFLWQGQPPPAATQYGVQTAGIPTFISDYTQGLLAKANAVAAEPYQVYGAPRIANFTADQNAAFDATRDAAGSWKPGVEGGMNLMQQAATQNPLQQIQPLATQAAGMSATGAAQPFMTAAATPSYQNVQNYMNPYQDAVVDRIATLGNRNLTENILPGMGDVFTRAGQFGSRGMIEKFGNAMRDTQEGISAQQSQALAGGFNMATQAANTDAARMAGIGQTMGNLTTADQGQLGNLAQLQGNMASITQNNQMNLGTNMGALGRATQAAGLTDAAALEGIGQTQQNQTQKNLDLAYQDFVEQRDYPKTQVGFLNNMLRGVPAPTSTTSATTGTNNPSAYAPSPLQSLVQSVSLAGALSKARGGAVRGYKRGGPVQYREAC